MTDIELEILAEKLWRKMGAELRNQLIDIAKDTVELALADTIEELKIILMDVKHIAREMEDDYRARQHNRPSAPSTRVNCPRATGRAGPIDPQHAANSSDSSKGSE